MTIRQLGNVVYFMLSENRDKDEMAKLDAEIYADLPTKVRDDAERVAALRRMRIPVQVVN